MYVVFFFQAEDGIRDKLVTGVQTCALPISCPRDPRSARRAAALARSAGRVAGRGQDPDDAGRRATRQQRRWVMRADTQTRSEEHTSELQSLAYLVCRLLLEKKKKTSNT